MLQGANDADFFPVPEGQLLHALGSIQLQAFAKPFRFLLARFLPQLGRKAKHVSHTHSRIKYHLGGQIADLLQDLLLLRGNVFSKDGRAAAVGTEQSQQRADGRTLSRAVRTDKSEELPLLYRQI